MFNGYNQPSFESDVGRDNTLKKSSHAAPWNYSQSYYNNSELQQSNPSGTWPQKLPYPNVAGKCACVQCQQGPWYHKEIEPVVPSSANPDMMLLGPGIGGGGSTDYPMDTYPRPEAFIRNNVPVSKKFSSCSYPTPNSQMYSHRLPNIKQNVSEFTNFDRNSDQYMRMFEASSYGRKPVESRPKYWDSVNGGYYQPQQYQYPAPCRYPPYNPPFYYPNANQSQSYQHPQHPPQQNGIQQYYGIPPNPMRQMEVPQPMAHNYLKQDNNSKISPLRLMRKKKLAESVGQPSPPRMAQVTDNTPALDVRRFLATWADEDEESPTVPQMVVLDCQDINAEQAELLRLYESSTSVRLVPESCIEQVTRSDSGVIPNKNIDEIVEVQPAVRDVTLASAVPDDYSQEEITPVTEVRETVIENQQTEESNGSPLASPASTANSQDSLPVLADLPTSEYRKNKFLDYDQQSFPLIPTKPAVNEPLAVTPCRLPPTINPTEEDTERCEKKNSKKRSRKPTIKFSIQKSHDLKISLRVLNESKSNLDQDETIKNIDRKDEGDARDLITVSLDGGEDDTLISDISQKRAKKLKRRKLLEQTYSVSSEDHCNDVISDGFQVEESVDSAKIKLTFKRRKGERDQLEIPKKRKKAKRIKEEKDNKLKEQVEERNKKVANSDWKPSSPEEPPAADTTTDFYGQPPTQSTEPKLETPLPSPTQFSAPDFPENVTSSPLRNENIPSFTTFDQPDSSHENCGNKNTISQHSNTSSPKISSSCHITSPRTSTDSIERELQAIWSGRSNEIKFNEDDRITSNDNVVDFYTEDISTGPINIEPVKQEISEASSVSPSKKFSSPTSDFIEQPESYLPVNENLSVDKYRSPVEIPNENFDTQCKNENSNNRLSLTTLNAHSPSSELSTVRNVGVYNHITSEITNLNWQEPVLSEISSICNTAGNENNCITPCDCRNEAVKQPFESNPSEDSNQTILSTTADIVSETIEPLSLENKIPIADSSSVDGVGPNHDKIIEKDVIQDGVEKTNHRSDIDTDLMDVNLNNITSAKEEKMNDSSSTADCIKSPTHLSDKKSDESENKVCSSELLTKLSFDDELDSSVGTADDIENFKMRELNKEKINCGSQQPNIEVAKSFIHCGSALEVEKERLGPRTPDGSPGFLNSSISPAYSEYCESPFNTEIINQAEGINDQKVHNPLKEMSSTEKINQEIILPSASDLLKNDTEDGAMNYGDKELITPLKSIDLHNDNDKNVIKSTKDFNTNNEMVEITNKDSFDLNTNQLECEVDLSISKACHYKDKEDVSATVKLLNIDDSCTEVQLAIGSNDATSENSFNSNLAPPVDSFDLMYERERMDLKPCLPLVDLNTAELQVTSNSTINKLNDSEMDLKNKDEECSTSFSLDPLDSTYEKSLETTSLSPTTHINDMEIYKTASTNISTSKIPLDTHILENSNEECVEPVDTVPNSVHERKLLTELTVGTVDLNQESRINSVDFVCTGNERVEEREGTLLLHECITLKNDILIVSQTETIECDPNHSIEEKQETEIMECKTNLSIDEKQETEIMACNINPSIAEKKDAFVEKSTSEQFEDVKDNVKYISDSIVLNLVFKEEEIVNVSNSENVTCGSTPPVPPIASQPPDYISNSEPVSIIQDETKKTDINYSDDNKLVNNDNNSSGDEENMSENISKTFVTFNFISPLNSPQRDDEIQLKVVEIDSEKYVEQEAGSEQSNDYDSMESIELEADENANIIIGVDESSDLSGGDRNEYVFEKPNDDANMSDNLSSHSDCNDVCSEFVPLNEELQKNKLEKGEIIEGEYIVVSDDYICPIMMAEGVLIEIGNEESSSLDIKVEDIPLPPGDAPKQSCFNHSKWLEDNCNHDNLSVDKCVSPFTSDVLGMFRNPSPPGTPRMVMSPTSPTANDSTMQPLTTEVEETEEEADGLPDDAEFQHVMENCMANARKFLSGEIDEKRIAERYNEHEDNVSRRDVLLSSFEAHSDAEIGCEAYSAEVTIAFSPFNTVIASETLPVDNWPYLEEEVPLSPQWPSINEEDIPLQDNECLESTPPIILNTDKGFAKETKLSSNSNRMPRIRRRTFESSSNSKVRHKKFLSERELNESDNEFEIFSDFKCHLSLDRLALKDVIGKNMGRPRKKSIESDRKCKDEYFKGDKWQPKVVLTKMSDTDKTPFLEFPKIKNIGSNKKRRSSNKIKIISDKSKVVENIESISKAEKRLTLKEVLCEPTFKKSTNIKSPAKLTLSSYKARKGLSNQINNNKESQAKGIKLKTQDMTKTHPKVEVEYHQKEKKRHIEEKSIEYIGMEKSHDKVAKIDSLDTLNHINNTNSSHKIKHGHVKKCSNAKELKNDDGVSNRITAPNQNINDEIIKVSDSSSKKCKEEGNYRIDKVESRSEIKKSSHKKKASKEKVIDKDVDSNKKVVVPCLSKKESHLSKELVSLRRKNGIHNKSEKTSTSCNVKEVTKCGGGDLVQKAHEAVEISNCRTALDGDNSDDSEPWVCAVCGFDDLKQQQKHIQEHAFHCQGCHLAFISEDHFIKHLSKKHEDIRKIHHCLLCELSFETIERYNEHLQTREHKHLEEVEKSTIHTLFTLLCGEPCPVLGPVTEKPEWLPNQAGTVHFYHQATPLSLATQYWKKRQGSSRNAQ